MDRYHNGEREHRRDEYRRDGGTHRFRDHDEQDFTQRSFADRRDADLHRLSPDRFPEDDQWRSSPDRDERMGMSRYQPEYGRHGGWPRDEFESWGRERESAGAPYGTGEWRREGRPDPGAYEGRARRRSTWDEGRGWDERGHDGRGRRQDMRGGYEGRSGESSRYGRDSEHDLYGSGAIYEADDRGHRSQQGWRAQHGWGRDIARDLDAGSDPYGGRFAGRGPKSYQRGDERVREDVCDRLTADARVDASDITVRVQNGEVTLEGTVDDRAMKRRAEDTADAVDGVRQVHNRLTVQNQTRSDEEMQPFQWGGERGWRGWEPEAGRGGFATRDRDLDPGEMFGRFADARDYERGGRFGQQGDERGGGQQRAGVHGSYGQLGRSGEGSRGSMRAEQQGAWLGEAPGRFGNRGPKGYQRSDDRIREDVCDHLTADAAVDATNITVTVKEGEVTIEGSVDDRSMKRRAEDCADRVAGVRQVHNRLVVQPQHDGPGNQTSPLGTKEPATSIGTSAASGTTAASGSATSGMSSSGGGKS